MNKMNFVIRTLLIGCMILITGLCQTASAETNLHGRLPTTPGGADFQAYYDDVLNITWLTNAKLSANESFGISGVTSIGAMDWNIAQQWISAMNTQENGCQVLSFA